ncbi:hypothetical protein ASG25_10755 [Rhizobium sp. Leaf384]|uniref:hypothetical protein n=1 Tax=Rhizobium sp. Leaf384 TaxID=1736358 RepID=UPI0007161704|nr:hypothetical protein [Rhizobium sp. Leaf384]KQS79057.1 hypothetical protein ASG25_10755 [Rhizobium sp. Leaf384]
MKLSAILAPLIAAGVPGEVILATVRAFEDQQVDAIERRRAADRERQQRHRHVTSPDVTVTERDTPAPDKERSPTPPKEINPTPASLRSADKRGTRLPDDWQLPAGWGQWAIDQGHSEASIRLEADRFRDHWIGKSGRDASKADWLATWRNWMRSAPKPRINSQAPPRETEHARHQRESREAIEARLNRMKPHDEFASDGPAFDLEPRDFRAH